MLACYVVNTSPEDDKGKVKCQPVLEDYYECLHHKKEVRRRVNQHPIQSPTTYHPPLNPPDLNVLTLLTYPLSLLPFSRSQAARTLALQAAYRKAEANIKRDDAPSAGDIRRLGVLDAPLEEKNLKASKWFPHKEIN